MSSKAFSNPLVWGLVAVVLVVAAGLGSWGYTSYRERALRRAVAPQEQAADARLREALAAAHLPGFTHRPLALLCAIVRHADAAMLSAKSLGRNQPYVFAEPDDNARVPRAPVSPAGRENAARLGRAARGAAEELLQSVVLPLPHYRGKPSELRFPCRLMAYGVSDNPEYVGALCIKLRGGPHGRETVLSSEFLLIRPDPLAIVWRHAMELIGLNEWVKQHHTFGQAATPLIHTAAHEVWIVAPEKSPELSVYRVPIGENDRAHPNQGPGASSH